MAEISGPHSTLQHPSGLASLWHSQGLGCLFPDGAQGGSGRRCQVSAGSFPSLSLSCCRARGLLKNLFHSSRHGGGNDGWCLREHLSSRGWGTAFPLPVCSWFQGRAWDLHRPGMEVRIHLPPPTLHPPALRHLTPKSGWAFQPCSMTGKGAFGATVSPLRSLQHPCQVFGSSPRSICLSARQEAQSKLGSVQDAVPPQTLLFYRRTQCQGLQRVSRLQGIPGDPTSVPSPCLAGTQRPAGANGHKRP